MLVGLWTAWMMYIRAPGFPAELASHFRIVYGFLLNKWYFDELYDLLFVRPAFAIGRLFWHRGDEKTIDRFGPNGSAWVVALGSRVAGRVQTGYVYTYAFVMLLGLTGVVTWAIYVSAR
jgi:NADH-quinone oxidoreductase subunit L